MSEEREIAKCTRAELVVEDHGILTLDLLMESGGWGQGLPGYALDEWDEDAKRRVGTAYGMEFVARMMRAFNVTRFSDIKGRTVFIVRDRERGLIRRVEPLPTERGEPFDMEDFRTEWFGVSK